MRTLQEAVEIAAPAETAYAAWTRFEELPRGLHGVQQVRRIDAQRFALTVEIGGTQELWLAEITQEEPGRFLAWRSLPGARTSGRLLFESLGAARFRLRLELNHQPEAVAKRMGVALGRFGRRVRRELESLARAVESGALGPPLETLPSAPG